MEKLRSYFSAGYHPGNSIFLFPSRFLPGLFIFLNFFFFNKWKDRPEILNQKDSLDRSPDGEAAYLSLVSTGGDGVEYSCILSEGKKQSVHK